jgi:peptide chain release factor 1
MIPEDRLRDIAQRFAFLEAKMQEPLSPAEIAQVSREWAQLRPVVEAAEAWRSLARSVQDTEAMLAEADLRPLAEEELPALKERLAARERDLRLALLPKDAADARPAMLEIRPGTVLPEAEEVDVQINPGDLRIDTMRSSGAGGQHVNTTDSAVRITHLPTGLVVTSSQKSQHRNRDLAMQVLRARLYEMERARTEGARSADRKSQVGTGDRSERIRTYNVPQGRLTDHRIGLTLYRLDQILGGDLGEVVDALTSHAQAEALARMGE